eukprot:gene34199-42168_t
MEYDRVHYPLPLLFEEVPTLDSLQRTIVRLKRQCESLKAENANHEFSTENERELRSSLAQFRAENQELKHRLRQAESRLSKQNNSAALNTSHLNAQHAAAASNALNSSILVGGPGNINNMYSLQPESKIITELKRRLLQSERELRSMKLSRGYSSSTAPTNPGPSYRGRDPSPRTNSNNTNNNNQYVNNAFQ